MPARHTILIVDDDESARQILKSFLSRSGFDVHLALDGREALELVHAGPPPDLILLDLQMPVMSGFEVLSAMRVNPAWAVIPTIILTASEGFSATALGVAGLLRKPFHDAEVQSAVAQALGRPGGGGETLPSKVG